MKQTDLEKQSDAIANIAFELPEQPNQGDILRALLKAYRAGVASVLNRPAIELGAAIVRAGKGHSR